MRWQQLNNCVARWQQLNNCVARWRRLIISRCVVATTTTRRAMAMTSTRCAMATTTSASRNGNNLSYRVARWQRRQHVARWRQLIIRQQQHSGCGNNICYPPAPCASTTCRVKAPMKNKVLRCTMATTYHLRCGMATTYTIALPNGDN